MKEQDITKVEFLLMCNENIVVQRFFNVRGFNKTTSKSESLHNYVTDLCNEMMYDLKMRSVVYMLDNQFEISESPEVLNTSITEGPENFNLIIRIGDMTICQRQFDAKVYPPKADWIIDKLISFSSNIGGISFPFSSIIYLILTFVFPSKLLPHSFVSHTTSSVFHIQYKYNNISISKYF